MERDYIRTVINTLTQYAYSTESQMAQFGNITILAWM